MMNVAFDGIIAASDSDRRGLFLTTGQRMNTGLEFVEKDFWVCWTLDALFNGLQKGRPRLLFKGGTSLSKAFALIERFSEDVDLVVFRDDLGQAASVDELEALPSNTRRLKKLEAIKAACQAYITDGMLPELAKIVADTMARAGINKQRFSVSLDERDPDRQSIRFVYPSVAAAEAAAYIEAAVRIESGARSALDPHEDRVILPYVSQDVPGTDLSVVGVTTIVPSRTFWDKVMILHGLRQWYDKKNELRHGGQRVSRHYFDVYALLRSDQAERWVADTAMAADCARHASMFFGSPHYGLELATPGSFTFAPTEKMRDELARDYAAMAGMIFGRMPALDDVLKRVGGLEKRLNAAAPSISPVPTA